MIRKLKAPLFVAAVLCSIVFAACSREVEDLKSRAEELCQYIPDHELLERSKEFMTSDFYAVLDTMFNLPEHEAMDHEWLYYFVTGNGGTIADFTVDTVEVKDETHAVALLTVRQKWEDGSFCEDGRPIMLLPGWNWIGYTVNGQQSLTDALADYMAEEGEKIVGQNGFATYEKGKWQGTLTALETGMGYMLYTNQAKALTFRTPSVKVRLHHRTSHVARTRSASLFRSVSKHAYPNVMGIIAEIQKDDEKVDTDRFVLYAYDTDGECRGEGTWVNGLTYMTLYGEGGEALSYRAVDLMDGTVYAVQETIPFAEGITGSVCQPFLLTLGKVEGNATMIEGMLVAPASSEIDGYYNLNGSRVSFRTACRGIYLVKYKDGSFKKVIVK